MFSIHWPSLIDKIPSPIVEAVSGLLFVGGAALALTVIGSHPLLCLGLIATAGSLLYEWKLDANGFSVMDVAQREVGILLGLAIAFLVHH